jgi:hypothetical protein
VVIVEFPDGEPDASGREPLRGNARTVDAGRNGLLALFELLGEEDERVVRYRALLQEIIH